ncbi:MAG: hypothetical protein ACI93T_001746 [Porticoccaceae bacterium]|jgi:hypothetical protein
MNLTFQMPLVLRTQVASNLCHPFSLQNQPVSPVKNVRADSTPNPRNRPSNPFLDRHHTRW